jgi:hypothetical protein
MDVPMGNYELPLPIPVLNLNSTYHYRPTTIILDFNLRDDASVRIVITGHSLLSRAGRSPISHEVYKPVFQKSQQQHLCDVTECIRGFQPVRLWHVHLCTGDDIIKIP